MALLVWPQEEGVNILLAMLRDGSFAEVRLERRTRDQLSEKYDKLAESFLNASIEVLDYAPAFSPEPGTILRLKYDLPQVLTSCSRQLPADIPELDQSVLADEGISAVVAIATGPTPRFCFQAIDNRFLVKPRSVALFFGKTFQFSDAVGIVFPDRLDALSINGQLYFRSEIVVRRFLDIEAHFKEATDAEMEEFFAGKLFVRGDITLLKEFANTPLRRKLHGVIASGRHVAPKEIEAVAKRLQLNVQLKAGKVILPTSPEQFRDLVRILDDAYLESMLDRRDVYLTTSKRKLTRAGGG
jgi:hypothetical protein